MIATAIRYDPKQNNFRNPESRRRNNLFRHYAGPAYRAAVDDNHRPAFPFVCSFEFTNRCNLNCVFCPRQVMTRPLGHMSENLLHKAMAEFAPEGTFLKVNGYGEPLLHPQALDFIRYIKKTNGLYFTTNGTLIDEQAAACFVESALDVVQISFQGADKAGYESQRQYGSYDKLFANLRTLVRIRGENPYPFIHLSTTILDEPRELLERFIETAFEANADSVGIGRTDYDRVIEEMITDSGRRAEIARYKQRQTLRKVPDHTYLYRYCDINWDGVVVSSFFDFNAFVPVGDLRKQTLREIWNSSRVLNALRVLEGRRLLGGFQEVAKALETLRAAGVQGQLNVFDTFYHAWQLGEESYDT